MSNLYILKNGCWEDVKNTFGFFSKEGRKRIYKYGLCYYCGELDNRHGYELKYDDCYYCYTNNKLL